MIWNRGIENGIVSPNGKYILIITSKILYIVSSIGVIIDSLTAVKHFDDAILGEGFWRNGSIQWNNTSDGFYLIKDVKYEPELSQLFSEKAKLFYYNLGTRKTDIILNKFPSYHYFFSTDYNYLFYSQPASEGSFKLTRYNLLTHSKKDIIFDSQNNPIFNLKKESGKRINIFYNFDASDFGYTGFRSDYLENKAVITIKSRDSFNGGLYIFRNKKFYHILKVKDGYQSLKNYYNNISLNGSIFLPGNRYLLFELDCDVFTGKIIIDTEADKYDKVPDDLEVFFNINSNDTKELIITKEGIKFPFQYDNDEIRKFIIGKY